MSASRSWQGQLRGDKKRGPHGRPAEGVAAVAAGRQLEWVRARAGRKRTGHVTRATATGGGWRPHGAATGGTDRAKASDGPQRTAGVRRCPQLGPDAAPAAAGKAQSQRHVTCLCFSGAATPTAPIVHCTDTGGRVQSSRAQPRPTCSTAPMPPRPRSLAKIFTPKKNYLC